MKQTYTQRKIVAIVKENTGKHFLDSGGAYGRHWERNQAKRLDFREGISLSEWGCEIPIHVFMDTLFETNKTTAMFNKALNGAYYWTQDAMEVLLNKFEEIEVSGGYLEGWNGNTYNFDNDLSQDFKFHVFRYDMDYFCVFQLHNGCDIRGGYCDSVVFQITDIDYFVGGMTCDFYDQSNDEQFESVWQIQEDERYELNEEKGCFINLETSEEVYPYSLAMGI